MRACWLAIGLGLAMIAADVQAQQASGDAKNAPKTLTLTGCVQKGSAPNQYVIDDDQSGKFQVTGNRIERYLGQRVELVGSPDTARLKIKGGLYPTPNVAGQAGAIDPVQAAIAAQPGGPARGTGDADLPGFKVRSVKTLDGGCR